MGLAAAGWNGGGKNVFFFFLNKSFLSNSKETDEGKEEKEEKAASLIGCQVVGRITSRASVWTGWGVPRGILPVTKSQRFTTERPRQKKNLGEKKRGAAEEANWTLEDFSFSSPPFFFFCLAYSQWLFSSRLIGEVCCFVTQKWWRVTVIGTLSLSLSLSLSV